MNLYIKTEFGEFNFSMDSQSAQEIISIAFEKASTTNAKPSKKTLGVGAKDPQIMAAATAVKQGTVVGMKSSENKPKSRVEAMFGSRDSWNTPAAAPKTAPAKKTTPKAATASPDGYKGFLWIKCSSCGHIKGFCAKQPMTTFICKECGKTTSLVNLRIAHVRCGCCDRKYDYKTNISDEQFTIPCLNCEAPVDMEINHAGTTFVVMDRPV